MAIKHTAVSYYGFNYVEHAEKDFIEMKEHSQKKAPATDIASASTRSGGTEDEESTIWNRN